MNEERVLNLKLMEQICDSVNLNQAYRQVKANKGAPGVDGITIEMVKNYIAEHKEEILQSLLDVSYKPNLVRGVQIPKPDGSKRQLGIPTVLDRVIQQAILQVLEPLFEPKFSDSSYGFRPRRGAQMALKKAKEYVQSGYIYVVDMDLEKFFDRVNHDILMERLSRHIGDKRLLKIIRRYLEAGLLQDGIKINRELGMPQGGNLSPLLSNILLDELDKELESRGHKFCRYADDCNIYVKSIKAGERVLESVTNFLSKGLKLQVNKTKSEVAQVRERKFLGYSFRNDGDLRVAPQSLEKFKKRIRELTKRNRGRSLEDIVLTLNCYLNGWISYFKLSASTSVFRNLDSWIRRRLRCYRLKQRKRTYSIYKFLVELGVSVQESWKLAKSSKGWWRLSLSPNINMAMSNEWFKALGLVNLETKVLEFRNLIKTAVCDNARTVV
jgi:RNA-directed DNA polymerase